MYLAIINDAYKEVKAEVAARKMGYEMADYFRQGYNNVADSLFGGGGGGQDDIESALKLLNPDESISYEELRQILKR